MKYAKYARMQPRAPRWAVVALLALALSSFGLPAGASAATTDLAGVTGEAVSVPGRCYYSQGWYPYWWGQGDMPQAKLRVLANGEEIVNKSFCFNELWVWLGDLREEIVDLLEGTLNNKTLTTDYGTFTVQSMSVQKAPFETLLVSMQFQEAGDLDLLALTGDVQASAQASGTVRYLGLTIGTVSGTVSATLPKVLADGVHRNFSIEEWELVWPGAYANTSQLNFQLGSWSNACQVLRFVNLGCAVSGFVERLVEIVGPDIVAGIVEDKGFEAARSRLEQRLDPNNAIASLLGDNTYSDIGQGVQAAANALGISIPSPPCGTRFTLYVENPPADRSSGGTVTIALFAPQ